MSAESALSQVPSSPKPSAPCGIRLSISVEELAGLLGIVVESFKSDSLISSPETQQPPIDPNLLSSDFSPQKDHFYYIQPYLSHSGNRDPYYLLMRKDTLNLLKSIQKEISKGEFGDISGLDEAQLDILEKIENSQISNTKATVFAASEKLLAIVQTLLPQEEAQEEQKSEIAGRGLPDQLLEIANLPFSITVSWKRIFSLTENLRATEVGQEFVTVAPESITVPIESVRVYLNNWLKELYSEETIKILARKRLTLPVSQAFISSANFFAYIDIKEVNKSDHDIADFILKDIKAVIDEFLKIPDPKAGPSYASESTEEAEAAETITPDTKQPGTENDIESLISKFSNAHASYSAETARLTVILFPQFFRLHGIELELRQLETLDPITFLKIQREFQLELEKVLRSLSPAEFALLQDGKFLQFRMLVLRRLYSKLATNPKFLAELLNYKQVYLSSLPPAQREVFQQTANVTDTVFDKKMEAEEAETPANKDWTQALQIQSFGDLSQATRADFRLFFRQILQDPKADYDTIFLRLDTLIAERWSPDKVRVLQDPKIFQIVFGFAPPAALNGAANQARLNQFLNLAAEYMHGRRLRLAKHYQNDSIARTSKELQGSPAVSTSGAATTQADFQKQFGQLLQTSNLNYTTVFLRLDSLAAQQWTPDKIQTLRNPRDFQTIFGFAIPTELAGPQNTARLDQFLKIAAAYVNEQKLRLATSAQAPSQNEIDSLDKAIKVSEKYKDHGGAEVLIVARSSNRARVREYVAGGNSIAPQVQKLHDEIEDERLEERKSYLRGMTTAERQRFLQDIGVLPIDTAQEASELQIKSAAKTTIQDYQDYIGETSEFEEEDGLVEDTPLEASAQAQPEPLRYGRGTQARSLMRARTNVRRSPLNRVAKKAKDAVKSKVLDGIESAVTSAVLGPAAVIPNKTVRRGILGGIGFFVADTIGKLTTSLGAQIGGAVGAVGGGIAGTLVPIPGVGSAFGAFWGGVGGAQAGYAIEQALTGGAAAGGSSSATSAFTPSLPAGIKLGGTETAKLPSLANLAPNAGVKAAEVVKGVGKSLFGPYVAPVALTCGVVGSALLTNSALLSGFGPPPMPTYDGAGGVSEFVILTKEISPGITFDSPVGVTLTYTLKVKAKDSVLEISELKDSMVINKNPDLNDEANIPIPTYTPPLNFEPLKTDGRITLQPNQELTVATYTISLDDRYRHTNLTNTFEITFDAITNGTREVGQTASTSEVVCFGECPKGQEGAWPVTGRIQQGPGGVPNYDGYPSTHGTAANPLQAIDFTPMAGREMTTKAFVTFAGEACAYASGSGGWRCRGSNPACYGNHVVINADNGLTLGYAHLASFSTNLQTGSCTRVAPGDEVGIVGNTGMGAIHLHYEVRGGRMIDIVPGNQIEKMDVVSIYDN